MTTEQTPTIDSVMDSESADFASAFIDALDDVAGEKKPEKEAAAPKEEPAPEPKEKPEPEPKEKPEPESKEKPEPEPKEEKVKEPAQEEPTARAPVKEAAHTDEPAKESVQAEPTEFFSADEKAALVEFEKEWPDIAKAVNLRMAEAARTIVQHVFDEVQKYVAPALQYTEVASETDHAAALLEAHPDYSEVYPKVVEWIDSQPAYLQKTYKQIQTNGTADDVIDMIARAKKELGIATEGTPPVTVKKEESAKSTDKGSAPSPAKKAASRLSVVDTKRSEGVASGTDQTDFHGSFAEALKSV
jgi:hypothetical protein